MEQGGDRKTDFEMKLSELIQGLQPLSVRGNADVEVSALCSDSRQVTPGAVFVAVRGYASDGHAYIPQAIARGAVWHAAGLIADEPDFTFTGNGDSFARVMRYWLNIRFLQGRDVRKALVALEAAFRTGGKWDWRLVSSFAALCFWIGWRQGLDSALAVSVRQPPQTGGRYDEDTQEVFRKTLEACRFAMDGIFLSWSRKIMPSELSKTKTSVPSNHFFANFLKNVKENRSNEFIISSERILSA